MRCLNKLPQQAGARSSTSLPACLPTSKPAGSESLAYNNPDVAQRAVACLLRKAAAFLLLVCQPASLSACQIKSSPKCFCLSTGAPGCCCFSYSSWAALRPAEASRLRAPMRERQRQKDRERSRERVSMAGDLTLRCCYLASSCLNYFYDYHHSDRH